MPEPFDETDDVIARKLAEIAPPADLRARLLAAGQPAKKVAESRSGGGWWTYRITAAAAVLALVLGMWSLWLRPHGQPISAATADLSAFLTNGFQFDMKTSDMNQVRAWLAANNPNHPVNLPGALAQQRPLGCTGLTWRGYAGSLACFKMSNGMEAHLAMFPTKTFSDAPGSSPQIASAGAWTRAAWSRDGMTYLLFVPAGMDPMKALAGAAFDQRFGKIASSSLRSRSRPAAKVSSGVARIASLVWT